MYSEQFEEYNGSEMFSAERHFTRKAVEPPKTISEPPQLLQLDALINRNSDAVLCEAKQLIDGWLDKTSVSNTMFEDAYDYLPRWMGNHKQLQNSNHFNQENSLKNQQNQIQPDLKGKKIPLNNKKQNEIIPRLKKKQSTLQNKIDNQIAFDVAEKELEYLKHLKALNYQSNKSTQQNPPNMKLEIELIQNQVDKMKEDEKKRMLKIAYSKAEMLYRIQHIRVLRTAFNSWVSITTENQKKCELFQITIRWNALNANWSFWRKRFTHTIQQKAIKMREMELRQNQIMLLKATRFERNKSFCRTLYHWQKLYLLKVTQKRFDNQRQQRARKMGAFLRQLESKYHTAHSPATQIEEHLIPKSETNSKSETIQKSNNLKSSKNTVAKTTKNPPVANVLSNQALKSIINISSNPVKKPLRPSKQDCKFIKEMEERDKVRKERQAKLQEQRLAREKEKERIRAEEEQKKLELEKQEKETIKKKRQEIEEQAKIILEKRAEERRIMNEKLNLASSKAIFLSLKFKGILPWKTYMLKCQQEKSMADDFHVRKQVARVYKLWKCIFDSRLEVLEERAVKFSGERLVNSFFRRWELKKRANDSQYTVAQTINEEGTARVIMRRWKQSMKIKRRIRLKIERDQEIIADNFARKCVPKRVLNAWKFFVNQQKEKRWREYRLSRLRTSAYEYLQQNSQLERQCNLFHIEMNGIE